MAVAKGLIAKTLIVLIIPVLIAGYAYHLWRADQQRWADRREEAELRYAQTVDLNCQLGAITDVARCAKALNYLAMRTASPN